MKKCPKCGTVYTDKTLSYCLSDGNVLTDETREAETEVLPNFAANLESDETVSVQTQTSQAGTDENISNTPFSEGRSGVSPFWILSTFGLLGIVLAGIIIALLIMSGTDTTEFPADRMLANRNSNSESDATDAKRDVELAENQYDSNTTSANTAPKGTPEATPESTVDPKPTASKTPEGNTYRVVGVKKNDVLYIRPSPGNLKVIVGKIPPNGKGIVVTGRGKKVGKSLWVPIVYQGKRGWVNRRYLRKE